MSPLVVLDRIAWRAPDGRLLFDDLSLSIETGLTGLIGANGSGKTTLLRLVAGDLVPLRGSVRRRGRIGLLRQVVAQTCEASIADQMGFGEDLARLDRIAAGAAQAGDVEAADWGAPDALRAALAGIMARRPDVLLLDEPTNNLDASARASVAAALARWRGAAVVASHDRALLEGMDRTVALSDLGAEVFGGGYGLYAARRAEADQAARRRLDDAHRDLARARQEAQAARERRSRRDRQGARRGASGSMPRVVAGAQSRRAQGTAAAEARLANRKIGDAATALEAAEGRVSRADALAFDPPPTGLPQGKLVLALERVSFAWPDAGRLFGPLSLRLTGPARLAICGPNGSGKTSLLRLCVGDLLPTAGVVRLGAQAAYLDQHAALLRAEETLLDAFLRLHPQARPHLAHASLARFSFRASAAERLIGGLSGGERLRAALACVLAGERPPQLLVLDEPTNHLDLASVQAVESALRGYDGALIVVSHDEAFLDAIGVDERLDLAGSGAA